MDADEAETRTKPGLWEILHGLGRAVAFEAGIAAVVFVYVFAYLELVPDSIGLLWKFIGLFAGGAVGLSAALWWRDRRKAAARREAAERSGD